MNIRTNIRRLLKFVGQAGKKRSLSFFGYLAIWLLGCLGLCEAAQSAEPIPEIRITALEQELEQGARGKSAVQVRVAFKSVARQASALLEASPEAPNRYGSAQPVCRARCRVSVSEKTARDGGDGAESQCPLCDV
jgi:hypothetical protein